HLDRDEPAREVGGPILLRLAWRSRGYGSDRSQFRFRRELDIFLSQRRLLKLAICAVLLRGLAAKRRPESVGKPDPDRADVLGRPSRSLHRGQTIASLPAGR